VKYLQKKHSISVVYEFLKDGINYTYQSNAGQNTYSYKYEDIGSETTEHESKNTYYYNTFISTMVIGIILLFYRIYSGVNMYSYLFLLASATLCALYHVTKINFTLLSTNTHSDLVILHGKDHDVILNKIRDMRRSYLRNRYYVHDKNNSQEVEARKFGWLMDEQIITEDEYKRSMLLLYESENSVETKTIQ